jgi:hypothetical protein
MSDQDDLVRVSSKLGNVVPDPLERHELILERDVEVEFRSGSSRDVRCRRRRARFGRARREAESAEAVAVRADVQTVGRVSIRGRRRSGESTAVAAAGSLETGKDKRLFEVDRAVEQLAWVVVLF